MTEKKKYVPRIRGHAIPKDAGWTWELEIIIGPLPENGGEDPIYMTPGDETSPFINKESALNDLKKHVAEIMKLLCEHFGHPAPDALHDLAQGTMVDIEEFAKPVSYK